MSEKEETTVSFGDSKAKVYGWIIGRMSQAGSVSCMLFGQFSHQLDPPLSGWIFIGRNIIQDSSGKGGSSCHEILLFELLKFFKFAIIIEEAKLEANNEYKASSENDLYQSEMESCRNDTISIKIAVSERISVSPAPAHSSNAPILNVTGCALSGVDGRYIENGYCNEVRKFRNVKGWVIFRQALPEIPELGIYADNCYDAFKGPSQRDLLDRRAGEYSM